MVHMGMGEKYVPDLAHFVQGKIPDTASSVD
jgi:hypothetical protein